MATLASSPPSSPTWPKRRPRAWALRCERYVCAAASYFPLAFVYGLTTWAAYVEVSIGFMPSRSPWIGLPTSVLGAALYIMLNASYSIAVFTDPGSPLTPNTRHEYSALPITELPEYTAYTVNSTGGSRYCKKCQCPKPDRTHHCSTCKRCVLKMDHHCPWLATCVGLRNYKAFLLFLIYTCLFCWVDFFVAALWIWNEMLNDTRYMDTILPINVVLLSILGGIIGLVLTGFTAWHISLAVRGMTTIECLEKTRYVSPLRKALDRRPQGHPDEHGEAQDSFSHRLQDYGHQILDAHANAIPGVTRAEEGEERLSPAPTQRPPHVSPYDADTTANGLTPAQQALSRSYVDLERRREQDRYEDYLNEADNEKMPNAFDLGWRKNLLHLFGPRPWLWFLPVCNTSGDGWHWEPSRKFLEARERVRQKREQELAEQRQYYRNLYQCNMDNSRSWLGPHHPAHSQPPWTSRSLDVSHDPERPATGVSMKTLRPMSPRPRPGDSDYEDSVEDEGDRYHRRGSQSGADKFSGSVDDMGSLPSSGSFAPTSKASSRMTNGREESDEWRDWD